MVGHVDMLQFFNWKLSLRQHVFGTKKFNNDYLDQFHGAGHGASPDVWQGLRVLRHVYTLAVDRRPRYSEEDSGEDLLIIRP